LLRDRKDVFAVIVVVPFFHNLTDEVILMVVIIDNAFDDMENVLLKLWKINELNCDHSFRLNYCVRGPRAVALTLLSMI